jgi:hypothetical protein
MLILSGCAGSPFLAHPGLSQKLSQIKNLAILPPRVDIFEVGIIETPQRIDSWSESGTKNLADALALEFKGRPTVQFTSISMDSLSAAQKAEVADAQLLLDVVRRSISVHVNGSKDEHFAEKIPQFDYSLGNFRETLSAIDADAFLIVHGFDQIMSSGSRAVNAMAVLAMGAAAGTGNWILIPLFNLGATRVTISLVDPKSGDILWYRVENSVGRHDLRDPASAAVLVKKLLEGFPVP